jgi:hypothetical protein
MIKSRRKRWVGHVADEKCEGKKPFGIPRCCWEADIEMECGDTNLIHLAEDRAQFRAVVNALMNFRVPLKSGMSSLAK